MLIYFYLNTSLKWGQMSGLEYFLATLLIVNVEPVALRLKCSTFKAAETGLYVGKIKF